ncbi:Receptor-like kinase [Melia azedarach]|uniref:Receptor-like kinase n=1 Tax=Melia azedarach TaxID=155640 RepID=A0ACC1Z2U9_MELAZ|nr:Receptor-like kinase [Melia azedarach]
MNISKNNSWLILSVVFTFFSLKFHVSSGAADTISAKQNISGDQTIVSAGGFFVLGFFNPSPGSLEAVLLDEGNLVLNDLSNNLSEPLWQSFDHPAHTWIPGMKLRYDKRTNASQLITSWKNKEDPAPGLYSLQLAPDGSNSYVISWNRNEQYWTSGPWDENQRIFTLVPEMRLDYIYNFSYVSNENESYFTYGVKDATTPSRFIMDVSGQIKQLNWLEDNKGWFVFWSQPRQQCEVYAYCGQFSICNELRTEGFCTCLQGFEQKSMNDWNLEDYSGGCVRKTQLECKDNSLANGESHKFLEYTNMALSMHPQSLEAENIKECASACLNNCTCTAYSYEGNGCSIWLGNLLGLQQLAQGGKTIYIKLAASELSSYPKNKNNKGIVIGGVVGSVAFVVLIGLITPVYLRKRRRRSETIKVDREKKVRNQDGRAMLRLNMAVQFYHKERDVKNMVDSGQLKEEDKEGIDLPFFRFASIVAATDNFSEANKLGKGGFGPVYKGKFPEGQEIAVKRLSSVSGQGLEEFKNEVVLIAKLQHRNLVRLLGYCTEGGEKILLYEYMPNKSLDFFIFGGNLIVLLDWEMRFNIILGIARGLLYLHQDSRLRIIHRDLKTSNILLDQEMNPKISDFGLARIFEGKQTEGSTNRVVGTYGYMSPEYALDGFFSVKSDVFSFGVVVLEIISGRKNTGFYNSEEALSLLGYAWRLWQKDQASDIMDQKVRESSKTNEILRCINVGLLCVQEDPNDRPTMSNIVIMLGSEPVALPVPKRPAFVVRRGPSSVVTTSSSIKPETNAELTNSLEGR